MVTEDVMQVSFLNLSVIHLNLLIQNMELVSSNQKLIRKLEITQKEACLTEQRSKRDPITPEIYQALINITKSNTIQSNSYTRARLRLAFCLLKLTGIRLNQLLGLQVYQLKTLLKEGYYCTCGNLINPFTAMGPENFRA